MNDLDFFVDRGDLLVDESLRLSQHHLQFYDPRLPPYHLLVSLPQLML